MPSPHATLLMSDPSHTSAERYLKSGKKYTNGTIRYVSYLHLHENHALFPGLLMTEVGEHLWKKNMML
jgi:hypothetical protein